MDSPATDPQALTRLRMFIDGEWTESASGDYFETFDPFTAKPWALVCRAENSGTLFRRRGRIRAVEVGSDR